jgi:hypothetical protein
MNKFSAHLLWLSSLCNFHRQYIFSAVDNIMWFLLFFLQLIALVFFLKIITTVYFLRFRRDDTIFIFFMRSDCMVVDIQFYHSTRNGTVLKLETLTWQWRIQRPKQHMLLDNPVSQSCSGTIHTHTVFFFYKILILSHR